MGRRKFEIRRDIFLEWEIGESGAFRELSATGIRVLLKFFQKRTWIKSGKGRSKKTAYVNTGLVFTYEEAATMGIPNTTFNEAVNKLIAVGFIDTEHQGGAYGKDFSRYAVSERWRKFGTESFEKIEKKRSLPQGMDVRSNMTRKQLLLRKSVAMSLR